MSRGSERVTVRMPGDLLDLIQERIKARNALTSEEPWTVGDYIRYVVQVDLKHRKRSNPKTEGQVKE